jgi:hypothetical protein
MLDKNKLPPQAAQLSSLFDVQPGPIQGLVKYCLALVMVESGKAKLVSTIPGDTGLLCTFKTATGEYISLAKPLLGDEQEREVKAWLRQILEEKG